MATFEVRVLGPFGVSRDGVPLEPLRWPRRAQRLLKLLATVPAHRRLRDELIEILWPDAPLDSGASNLRGAVLDLRRGLGSADPSPILSERGTVALDPAHVWTIDLDRFESLVASGEAAQTEAVELVRGEPLPEDRYEDWAAPIRDHVQHVVRDAVIRLMHGDGAGPGARLSPGDGAERALRWLEMLRQMDQLDEAVLRLQLQALGHSGR